MNDIVDSIFYSFSNVEKNYSIVKSGNSFGIRMAWSIQIFCNDDFFEIKDVEKYSQIVADSAREDLEKLSELHKKGYFKKLHFCHPIQCDTIQDAIDWDIAPFITASTRILYTHSITWKEIYQAQKQKIRLPIEVYLTEKKRFTNEEVDELVIQTLDKILFCIINGVKIQFKVNPRIRITEQFLILKRLCDWSCAAIQPSFYDFCSRTPAERVFLREFLTNHPNMTEWFHISPHEYKNNGGIWLNDRRTN
jgi:hypothetical protein